MSDGACILCGGQLGRVIRRQRWEGRDLKIAQCRACALMQIDPMLKGEYLNAFYSSDYFCCPTPLKGGYENYQADEPQIHKTFSKRLGHAASILQKPSSMKALDFGCATGVFLEVVKSAGWTPQGLELSASAARQAEQKGFNVFQGDWQNASFPEGAFGLISLWDVIEHLPDPVKALQFCYRWLCPEGYLLISTPDVSAWLPRLLGPYWLGYRSAGEHVLFFSRQTLTRLLEQSGFEVLTIQSVGKYMRLDRIITRLSYYTRLFRILLPFKGFFLSRLSLYVSSGDTMYMIARKRPS
jgi:2-polyprenyl-3-methyl-5-hydroxy-6-metoxy-1,4-benzoquinol methylase